MCSQESSLKGPLETNEACVLEERKREETQGLKSSVSTGVQVCQREGQVRQRKREGRGEGRGVCLLDVCWKCASVLRYFCEVFKNSKSS